MRSLSWATMRALAPLAPLASLAAVLVACADATAPVSKASPRSAPALALSGETDEPSPISSRKLASRCIDVTGGVTAAGTKVQLFDCNDTPAQEFTWRSSGEIRVFGSMCLDGGDGTNWRQLVIRACNGGASQKWTATTAGEIKASNGKCVDLYWGQTANDTPVQLYTCNGGSHQRWDNEASDDSAPDPDGGDDEQPEEPTEPTTDVSAHPTNNAPEMPRELLSTSSVVLSSTGRTIHVQAGDDLQDAINAAVPGDVLLLEAGATFTGNFELPKKSGTGWVTIRTSTSDGSLPPGVRVGPEDAPKLARINSPNSMHALRTYHGAHHYRLIGLEIANPTSVTYNTSLFVLGDGTSDQNELSEVAHDIIVDRSYVHGHSTNQLKRCLALNSARTVVMNSYFGHCHSNNSDSQAIGGWNGPGPYLIENNYLEAGSMMIMFGGADPHIPGLVPSDIVIRRNHFFRPTAWKDRWNVKNLFELKNAQRVLVEGNVFEHNWADAMVGFAFVWKSVNQSGRCTWCVVQDVNFRYNKVRRVPGVLTLAARAGSYPAINARRIALSHNVFEQLDTLAFTGIDRVFQFQGSLGDVTINHNTILTRPDLLVSYGGGTITRFDYRNTLANTGSYGIKGIETTEGTASLRKFSPYYTFARNVTVKTEDTPYPSNNFYPSSTSSIGFTSLSGGNYRLSSSSPYNGKATDGTDPGANIDKLEDMTEGVVQ